MWCSKHHPASRVKTGDLAEGPEDKQRTMGGLYEEQPCNHNTDCHVKAALDTNMYLELEQNTQVQAVITPGKQHRSFQCG